MLDRDERFQSKWQQYNKLPNILVVVRFRDEIPSDKGKLTFRRCYLCVESHEGLIIDLLQDTRLDKAKLGRI